MLKKLQRYAKLMEITIDTFPDDKDIVELICNTPEETGHVLVNTLTHLYTKNGLHPEKSQNPSYYTIYKPNLSTLNLNKTIQEALSSASVYTLMDKDVSDMPISCLWKTFIGTFGAYLGHQTLISSFHSDEKRIFLYLKHQSNNFMEMLHAVEDVLHCSFNISMQPADVPKLKGSLRNRLEQAKDVYLRTDREWTQDFYLRLGDDLSRAALLNFLRQRMSAKVFWDCNTYYTLTPPVESADWRCRRLRKNVVLPHLESPDHTIPFLYIHTFIFEQYAIPGIIEAQPGDIVLDIGSGIGDTSIYFSRKIHNTGHCFSFEPLDVNIKYLKKNIEQNQCENITIMPFALADKKGTGILNLSETTTTLASSLKDKDGENGQSVDITTVDDFSSDKRINFIKADIEGAELDMLHGARETLHRDKPVCALALYHKENDFRSLPQYLQSINPEYTFYIRCDAEPMLFAVCH